MLISYTYKRGQTSIVIRFKILDSSVSTGAGLVGLSSVSPGLIISTIANNEAVPQVYTGSNIESITTLGIYVAPTSGKVRFREVDSTNHKGVYELQIADARFAVTSAKGLLISIAGATNVRQTDLIVPLVDVDPYNPLVPADVHSVAGTVQSPGDIYPAIQGIGTATGAAVNTDCLIDNSVAGIPGVTVGTTKVGTQTNVFGNTSVLDGIYHVITGTATALDWVYQFSMGGGTTPVGLVWTGYVNSANDIVTIRAWNHNGAAWEIIGTVQGSAGTVNLVKSLALFARHAGNTPGEVGKVYIRFDCNGMTNPILSTDQIYITYAITSRTVGYANGAVWIDTINGTPGTEAFVNGTADHPVKSLEDALVIGVALGIERFYAAPGSALTLSSSFAGKTIEGDGYRLDLGGQDISGALFRRCASVTGIGTATSMPTFQNSLIGNVTLPPCLLHTVALSGTLTVGSAGDFLIVGGVDGLAGAITPVIDLSTLVGPTSFAIRDWRGGLEFRNVIVGDFLSLDGIGRFTFASSCTGGERRIRGLFEIEDSSTGMIKTEIANLTLASFFYANSGCTYNNAVDGSLVKEIRTNLGINSILGTTIPEVHSGQVATNLGKFFDVDPDTVKTVNDVGDSEIEPTKFESVIFTRLEDIYMMPQSANYYFESIRSENPQEWINATDQDKYKALLYATKLIERLNYQGMKPYDQKLQFPRDNQDLVPTNIQYACAEIALSLLASGTIEEHYGRCVKQSNELKTNDFYPPKVRAGIPSDAGWTLLSTYLSAKVI